MTLPPPQLALVRRADREDPIDDRKLRAEVAAGRWVRVTAGVYAPQAAWTALKPIERHRLLVLEVSRRMRSPATLVMHSAAALWGIDVLGSWPEQVDTAIPLARGGRSSGGIRRHARAPHPIETVPLGRHRVTTAAQTAADLARAASFAHGVAIVDQAIWSGRDGGALCTIEEILACLRWPHRGNARAMRAVSAARPLAANVRESEARVVMARLGFPTPRLQERRVLRSGRLVFGDFYFPSHDHWAELDGAGKYLSPEYAAGRSASEIVLDEKRRENEIRREVRGFSRFEPADLDDPRRLYDILTGDGLPSSVPRP